MSHQHTDACEWVMRKNGKRLCKTARQEREREQRAAGIRTEYDVRRRDYKQEPDGWEEDYGPVPLRVPNTKWYDEVIVLRLLNGERTGRKPTTLEWAAFFSRNKSTQFKQVVDAAGITEAQLLYHSHWHEYKWPIHLTGKIRARKEFA